MRTRNTVTAILMFVLVLSFTIGGTLAWLTDTTEPVTNTFTYGDINITLAETTTAYKMVPGNSISKDPSVTVESGSEACWLFVKVEESANFKDFMTYTIANGWTALENADGVYYREVDAVTEDTKFDVLGGNQVQVSDTVTKEALNVLTEATYPTLTFTAYAVQRDNIETAAEAWTIAAAQQSADPSQDPGA